MKQLFVDNFLAQLYIDALLSDELKSLLLKDFESFEISVTDGDRSTIGYVSDCIERISYDEKGYPETLEQAKAYVQNSHYNENLIGAKNYTTAKILMAEKLQSYL